MPAKSRRRAADPERVTAKEVDKVLARRIAEARTAVGMSQRGLAQRLGIAPQQISKIERAVNRCPASRLWQIAVATRQSMSFFYDGMDPQQGMDEEAIAAVANTHRYIYEMLQLYQQATPAMRRHINGMLRENISAQPDAARRTP